MSAARQSSLGSMRTLCLLLLVAPRTEAVLQGQLSNSTGHHYLRSGGNHSTHHEAHAHANHSAAARKHGHRKRLHLNVSRAEIADRAEPMSDRSKKQIKEVLEVLQDIFESISSSKVKEAKEFDKFKGWCAEQNASIGKALGKARDTDEVLNVEMKSIGASVSHGEKEFEDLTENVESTKNIMTKADNIRGQENDRFTDDMTINRQSLDQVDQAIGIIEKVHSQGGFLQQGQLEHLQLNEPGESSYVLGTMKGIKSKLEKTKVRVQADEDQKKKEYDSFMKVKKDEFASLQAERSEKRTKLTENKIQQVDKKWISKKNDKDITTLQKRFDITNERCTTRSSAFSFRQEEYTAEQKAIASAIEKIVASTETGGSSMAQFLRKLQAPKTHGRSGSKHSAVGSKVAMAADDMEAFVQMQVERKTRHHAKAVARRARVSDDSEDGVDADEADAMSKAFPNLNPVRQKPRQGPGFAAFVAELASGKLDRSDKAKEMVKMLIGRLEKVQDEEETKFKYCKSEFEKKDKELEEEENNLQELNAKISYKDSEIKSLGSELKELEEEIQAVLKVSKESRGMRKKEHVDYESTKKDRTLSIKVLKQAVQILQKFYASLDKTSGKKNLMQLNAAGHKFTPDRSTRRKIQGWAAIEMIEKVTKEVIVEGKTADKDEKEAVVEQEKLEASLLEEHDSLRAETTERVKRRSKLSVHVNTDKETREEQEDDISSLKALTKTLHEECDQLIDNFKTRTEARTFELSQLKDVLDIISGSSLAVRTGFLEQPEGAAGMSARELTLLREMSQSAARSRNALGH